MLLCWPFFPQSGEKEKEEINNCLLLKAANNKKKVRKIISSYTRKDGTIHKPATEEVKKFNDVLVAFEGEDTLYEGSISFIVPLVTALVSLFSQRRVRADTAMTGEMTLRGIVLPVGGVKDKVLAAHRSGIKRVILPERNLKDLVEVPSAVLASMEILLAKRMEDVLDHVFEGGCPWRLSSKL